MGLRGRLLTIMVMCIAWTTNVHAQSPVEENALTFLKGLPGEWSGNSARDCKTYEQKNIDRLSLPFAISAATFLRAFVAMHGHVTITSAHRTVEEQRCVCEGEKGPCAGRPRVIKRKKGKRTVIIVKRGTSHHQGGFALDVRAGTGSDDEFMCMHEFARINPSFGVTLVIGGSAWDLLPHRRRRSLFPQLITALASRAVRRSRIAYLEEQCGLFRPRSANRTSVISRVINSLPGLGRNFASVDFVRGSPISSN